jgi:hypothetical protein
MKKAVVLNDTNDYHHGCRKVMEYLHTDLIMNGYEIISSSRRSYEFLEECDLLVLNGEGTMHHDKPIPHELLSMLKKAKKSGAKTAMINSVWQSMTIDDEMKDVLSDTYISVREVKSQYAMYETIGKKVDVHLDLSFFVDVPDLLSTERDMVVGKFFAQPDYRPGNLPVVDIFQIDWDTLVNILRYTNWFITGRHHEMYASCKARCPFSTLSGNTWKNEGLFETAGVEIPVGSPTLIHDNIPKFVDECKEKRGEYEKLFNWMHRQPKFTIANKL